jgi:hypothetical protein
LIIIKSPLGDLGVIWHNLALQIYNMENKLNKIAEQLLKDITNASEQFKGISEKEWSYKPAPGKWSKKEILGHLIDSAANNHLRFVRAQLAEKEFISHSYEQDFFVASQHYQQRSTAELIQLWLAYNHHLSHVIKHIDTSKLNITCKIGTNEPVTLSFIINDYVTHLEHHLSQILSDDK